MNMEIYVVNSTAVEMWMATLMKDEVYFRITTKSILIMCRCC